MRLNQFSFKYASLTILAALLPFISVSCQKDELLRDEDKAEQSITRPATPGNVSGSDEDDEAGADDGTITDTPTDNGDEENRDEDARAKINGTWRDTTSGVEFTFASDGTFTGLAVRKLGFRVKNLEAVGGTYTYSPGSELLWLVVEDSEGQYMLEFACRIKEGIMQITGLSGTGTFELQKV